MLRQLSADWLFFAFWALALNACSQGATNSAERRGDEATPTERVDGPIWAKNANLYEVNIRQYTPEGDFAAFEKHLPRLRRMGVDILWFMPIHPISELNRKGELGSYYAAADYTGVNPEFGALEDFIALVDKIHRLGMKVLLDWVPNHTGWDHVWIEAHPEWYMLDDSGEIRDPVDARTGKSHGWTDVAELDYSQPELRRAMIEAMKFWLTETGIDGFRVDVASEVPIEFWREAVPELKAVNPDIFLLAEAENPEQRNEELFHMSYAWSFHHLMNRLAQGKAPLKAIDEWLAADRKAFKRGYHMHFIDNHDENSWNGTVAERLGPAADALAVLAFTFDGMPLLYSGQEARLDKRLAFFEKDQIDWRDFPLEDFYRALLELKRRNRALWNGSHGGHPRRINTGKDRWVYAFYREKDEDRVIVLLNLSSEPQEITLHNPELQGDYVNIFGNSTVAVTKNMMLKLNPWDYVVWSNR